MKKIRYFPFGYHMVDGKIVIRPEESALLQELFSNYLNGASLQQLADYAEGTGIRFRENAEHWNKNMIARMLDEIDSPAIVGMVDMDQMTYAGETVADYFANLGRRMQYVHFNDRGHTVPGDGDFPMKDYYEQIKAQGYDGCCSFEICDRRYYIDPDKAIDDTVAWMRANTHELD